MEHGLHRQWLEEAMPFLWVTLLVLATIPLAGCELAQGIFKAGVWVGVLGVAIVIGIVAFIAAKIRG
jgi:hypothetical protein